MSDAPQLDPVAAPPCLVALLSGSDRTDGSTTDGLLGGVVGPALGLLVEAGARAAAGAAAASDGVALLAVPSDVDPGWVSAGSVSPRMAAELGLVEAAERVRAWVDGLQVAALGRLDAASVAACRQLAVQAGERDPAQLAMMQTEGHLVAVDEVVAATGLGQGLVTARMAMALAARDAAVAKAHVVAASEPGRAPDAAGDDGTGDEDVEDGTAEDGGSGEVEALAGDGCDETGEAVGPVVAACAGGIGVGLAAMQAGTASCFRVGRVFAATDHLSDVVVEAITVKVLAPMPDGSVRSHRSFTRLLRTLVRQHTPDPQGLKRDALTRRDVSAYPKDDGTGVLSIVGDELLVAAVLARIDRIARAMRAAGDPRSLAQLRCDIALDLLARGWPTRTLAHTKALAAAAVAAAGRTGTCPTCAGSGSLPTAPGPVLDQGAAIAARMDAAIVAMRDRLDPDSLPDRPTLPDQPTPAEPPGRRRRRDTGHWDQDVARRLNAEGVDPTPADTAPGELPAAGPVRGAGDPLGTLDAIGAAPAATVHVVVTLATLLGLDDGVGHVPGWGQVPAAAVRAAATAAGSTWRRLVVDDLEGTAVELSGRRYRPTQGMADLVAALDGHCRAPGCDIPAVDCDLDHQIPWPQGATTVANLNAKHRRHHNHKTRRTWTCIDAPARDRVDVQTGQLLWRTLTGRRYLTTRINWLELLTPTSVPTTPKPEVPDTPPY